MPSLPEKAPPPHVLLLRAIFTDAELLCRTVIIIRRNGLPLAWSTEKSFNGPWFWASEPGAVWTGPDVLTTRHGCTTAAPGVHLLFARADLDWLDQNRCNQTNSTVREGCLHLSGTHTHTHTSSNVHTHTHTWTGMIGQTHDGTLMDERAKTDPC